MKKILCAFLTFLACFFLIACEDNTPYIGENGNWWVGDEDLGVQAQGPQGEKGEKGDTGKKGNKGDDGDSGKDGEGVTVVNVEKITSGLVDTYTIYFSDGTNTTFTVTNGEKGDKGDKGNPGYNGDTPYIGKNGNWWIGKQDTGILADYSGDARKISDGLVFETVTKNGVAGMIVTDYNGTDTDVVIPNYVGAVPVIAIARDAFEDNTRITSISLSKNTVYLEEYAFSDCTSLASIDFNGAQIEKIPNYAFYNTALTSIELPEQTTYLGDSAFDGTYLGEINYQNITHFGSYCLNEYFGHGGDYVYLDSKVEYVGSYAFDGVFVFAEHQSKPTNWASNIAGTGDWSYVTYGCKKDSEYIYTTDGINATVHYYIGNEKRIQIPGKIEHYDVIKIGYGFGSLGGNRCKWYEELFDDEIITISEAVSALTMLEEVKIPSGVSEIDCGTFFSVGTMIFIPKTVSKMGFGDLFDDINLTCYYAFESDNYPTFYEGFISYDDIVTPSSYGFSEVRIGLGISPSKVEYNPDNKCYYYNEIIGYSLLASMDFLGSNIVINSTFNGSGVYTVRSNAIRYPSAKTVKIENGITKIQSNAILCDGIFVYIPKSVTTINASGICGFDKYLVGVSAKPSEWDSLWAGSSTSSKNIQYSVDYSDVEDIKVNATEEYVYTVSSKGVSLVSYIGSSTTVKIPRKIDGIVVNEIKTGFFKGSGTRYFYIPSSVTIIESKAFVNTSTSTFYFYCEASSQPSTWASDFYYNSYYGSTTKYITFYWSQSFDY